MGGRQLKHLCFFRELGMGDDCPSIEPHLRDAPGPDAELLLAYLASGHLLAVIPELLRDAFNASVCVGAPNLRTDGVFVWSELLPYYVENYHIEVPAEFVDHARQGGWRVPPDVDLRGLRV